VNGVDVQQSRHSLQLVKNTGDVADIFPLSKFHLHASSSQTISYSAEVFLLYSVSVALVLGLEEWFDFGVFIRAPHW
jgi:hypothetical protein